MIINMKNSGDKTHNHEHQTENTQFMSRQRSIIETVSVCKWSNFRNSTFMNIFPSFCACYVTIIRRCRNFWDASKFENIKVI